MLALTLILTSTLTLFLTLTYPQAQWLLSLHLLGEAYANLKIGGSFNKVVDKNFPLTKLSVFSLPPNFLLNNLHP